MNAGETTEQSSAGELWGTGPLGQIEWCGWVRGGGFIVDVLRIMMSAKLCGDDGAHRLAFSLGGPLPVEAEALVADSALEVVAGF